MRFSAWVIAALMSVAATSASAAPETDLTVNMTGSVASLAPGDRIDYTITGENLGPDDADGVNLTLAVPSSLIVVGMTYPLHWSCDIVSVDRTGNVECSSSSNMSAGASIHFTLYARLDSTSTGTFSTTATLTSDTLDSSTSNNTSTVTTTITSPPAAIPTLTEWAMILFGTILAGGAALTLHRRRQMA